MRFDWPEVTEYPRAYWGLGRVIMRWPSRGYVLPPPPRGWRHLKIEYRNGVYELPVWLYWPVRWWGERWWVCELLCAWGVFRVKEEGGYYSEGRFCLPPWLYRLWWCFRHDTDSAPPRREYWGPPRRRPTMADRQRVYAILNRGKVA